MTKTDSFKVQIEYPRNGKRAQELLYTGTSKNAAEAALNATIRLAKYGVLTDCTISLFEGLKITEEFLCGYKSAKLTKWAGMCL